MRTPKTDVVPSTWPSSTAVYLRLEQVFVQDKSPEDKALPVITSTIAKLASTNSRGEQQFHCITLAMATPTVTVLYILRKPT